MEHEQASFWAAAGLAIYHALDSVNDFILASLSHLGLGLDFLGRRHTSQDSSVSQSSYNSYQQEQELLDPRPLQQLLERAELCQSRLLAEYDAQRHIPGASVSLLANLMESYDVIRQLEAQLVETTRELWAEKAALGLAAYNRETGQGLSSQADARIKQE